ncbi:unnamed protein product [Ectocarpus sp. 4 AP-2014]
MAVLMAKCERLRQAYSDYKHLSTDNLSFVAGLRGRPVPAPGADLGRRKVRRRPKPDDVPKGEHEEKAEEDDESSLESQGAKQACPSRSCAPRADKLEAMMEKRVAAQTARQKAQSRLGSARERSQEAETKLEEAKAELVRMTKAIAEGDERTETLQDTLRNEGSINKAVAEELDMLLVEAMNLRREFVVDTLPPRPTTVIVPVDDGEEDNDAPSYQEDGRSLRSPVIAPGQQLLARDGGGKGAGPGAGGPHDGSREWIHTGRLAHTGIFVRPPRPKSRCGSGGGGGSGSGNRNPPSSPQESSSDLPRNIGDSSSGSSRSGLPGAAAAAAAAADLAMVRDDGEGVEVEAEAATGDFGGGSKRHSEGEDAWSCCGKSVLSAGRGCEPREPLATPEDLLLDTIDPRSRLGQPLDFRDFLPQIAWLGLSPDPVRPLPGSLGDGTLRPHTAPERLTDAVGQWSLQGWAGGDANREYDRRASRSRNGGLVGGVWASGGRRRREPGGGLRVAHPPSPDSSVNAWWKNKTPHQWGGGGGGGGGGADGRGPRRRAGEVPLLPKRHAFLRRSHPTATTATYASSRSGTTHNNGDARTGGGGESTSTAGAAAARAAASAAGIDEFWPRTQILGMNGGRLPRRVRQVPIDRPLTAPCGKVGRRRVRTRSGNKGAANRP